MKKPIQISIPTPCHENWDVMTPADKGRFCASCQKKVFDFTNSSDREIVSVLKNTENACGRFSLSQLDRNLAIPKEKNSVWMAASAAVVSFLAIGNQQALAQTPVNTEQHITENGNILGKIAAPSTKNIFKGTVYDSFKIPLPGANIINTSTKATIEADVDGNFSIEAQPGNTIQISYVGFQTQTISIKSNTENTEITLVEIEEPAMFGAIASLEERTFFGRIFHSIGSIFR